MPKHLESVLSFEEPVNVCSCFTINQQWRCGRTQVSANARLRTWTQRFCSSLRAVWSDAACDLLTDLSRRANTVLWFVHLPEDICLAWNGPNVWSPALPRCLRLQRDRTKCGGLAEVEDVRLRRRRRCALWSRRQHLKSLKRLKDGAAPRGNPACSSHSFTVRRRKTKY